MASLKWNDEFLNLMREEGDPVADTAAKVLWENRDRNIIDDIKYISKNHHMPVDISLVEGLHIDFNDEDLAKLEYYFKSTDRLNIAITEEDKKQFEIYAKVFEQYGFVIVSLLFFKSLPTGYMCPKPSKVLHSTRLLEEFAARRVMETAQFIFAVSTPDWYMPDKKGIESIQKVRLMHAGMRYALLNNTNPDRKWDQSVFGIPINQEDLVFTNLLFSVAIIEGLDQFGINLTDAERRAFVHTWKMIGLALGISEQLMPDSLEDAHDLYRAIYDRNVSEDNAYGPDLTKALLGAMNEITGMPLKQTTLEDLTLYLIYDSKVFKSLGLHTPSVGARILASVIQLFFAGKKWRNFSEKEASGFISNWVNKLGNAFLRYKFDLTSFLEKHPNEPPLVAFSKTILSQLHQRDLSNFIKTPDRKKDFFIDAKLFEAWGLGGFHLDEDPSKVDKSSPESV